MGSIYKRGPFWWLAFKLPGGKRALRSSGISSSKPAAEALKMLALIEKDLKDESRRVVSSKTSVAEWALEWTRVRKSHGQTNAGKDFARLRIHALPAIGAKPVGSVDTAAVRAVVSSLRSSGLAARTVINTYGLVRRLFADAVAEGLIIATPCVLKRRDLPKKRDKDPKWRSRAVFTREEAEALLVHPSIPADRRVTYALGLLGGMREGEIAALRWDSLDRHTAPLSRLSITSSFTRVNKVEKSTKTENPRQVPVHPVLERILTEWQATGFASQFGREPRAGDLLVPNAHGGFRTDNTFRNIRRDLNALGLRHRRMHDTRRTFISLGRTDGANPSVLKSITHDQVGDQFDQYTTFTFETQCEAVLCLKLEGRVVQSAARATGTTSYISATLGENVMATTQNSSTSRDGQGGTRSRLSGSSRASHSPVSSGYGSSAPGSVPLRTVPRSNVATQAIETDLAEALADFRSKGDRKRLAARLRILLAQVRS